MLELFRESMRPPCNFPQYSNLKSFFGNQSFLESVLCILYHLIISKNIWSTKRYPPPPHNVPPIILHASAKRRFISFWIEIQTQMTNRSIEFYCILLRNKSKCLHLWWKTVCSLENVLRVFLSLTAFAKREQ